MKIDLRIVPDFVPRGIFRAGETVPPGTFHGGETVPAGTFHSDR